MQQSRNDDRIEKEKSKQRSLGLSHLLPSLHSLKTVAHDHVLFMQSLLKTDTRNLDVLERLVALVRPRLLNVVDDFKARDGATEDTS